MRNKKIKEGAIIDKDTKECCHKWNQVEILVSNFDGHRELVLYCEKCGEVKNKKIPCV